MKSILYCILLLSVSGLIACEKKSKWEKAADSMENAAEELGKAAKNSGDAIEEESGKTHKKIKKRLK